MSEFKNARQQDLFVSFVQGRSVKEAAGAAGCSEPTARKFRDEHLKDIVRAQAASVSGVLDSLKKLLPDAVARLEEWVRPPSPERRAQLLADFQAGIPMPSSAEAVRIAKAIFSCYEVMADHDYEARLASIEKRLQELTPPKPGEKG